MDSILKVLIVPLHREGPKFVGIFLVASLVLLLIWAPLGWIGLVLTVWCYYFFRDPVRIVPQDATLVLAAADGVVQSVGLAVPPSELELGTEPRQRVSVFMNVFDVHVNRTPFTATVRRVVHTPGKFVNAALDKASEDNERVSIKLESATGVSYGVVQIAGLVARRILCDVADGRVLQAGERFGMIRFGSRVDVYLPEGARALVAVGQRSVAGETVIGDLKPAEGERAFAAL